MVPCRHTAAFKRTLVENAESCVIDPHHRDTARHVILEKTVIVSWNPS
jgi:hypothetical protein